MIADRTSSNPTSTGQSSVEKTSEDTTAEIGKKKAAPRRRAAKLEEKAPAGRKTLTGCCRECQAQQPLTQGLPNSWASAQCLGTVVHAQARRPEKLTRLLYQGPLQKARLFKKFKLAPTTLGCERSLPIWAGAGGVEHAVGMVRRCRKACVTKPVRSPIALRSGKSSNAPWRRSNARWRKEPVPRSTVA
jgi:hypothetical protein